MQGPQDPKALTAQERLEALTATALRPEADEALDRFADLVRRLFGVPVALVSLVDDRRQFFPGMRGLPEPWAQARETGLSHSFCQHVVASGESLVIPDAPAHPLVCDNLAIRDLGVIAYAGMPLVDGAGRVLGSLCAIDEVPRDWSAEELELLADLAAACSSELQLRIALGAARVAQHEAERASEDALAAAARLQLMYDVARAVSSTLDIDEALWRLARLVVPRLADWCAIHRMTPVGAVERVAVVHAERARLPAGGVTRQLPPPSASTRTPLARVLQGAASCLVVHPEDLDDADDPLAVTQRELYTELDANVALVVALRGRDGVLGALTLARTAPGSEYSDADRELATELALQAALAMDNARLYDLQRNAAESLQASMLTELPQVAGVRLAARYRPASEGVDVGGDWYDAFPLPDGATTLVVGDVVGHDLEAAARMGQLRNVLRGIAFDGTRPASAVVGMLDAAMAALGVGGLATAIVGRIEPRAGGAATLAWCNAGHLPPLVMTAAGHPQLLDDEPAQLLLGIDPTAERRERIATLQPGDTLLLYTDGLVESRRAPLEQGLARLRLHAARHAGADLEDLCDGLLADLVDPSHHDDIALLAVRIC